MRRERERHAVRLALVFCVLGSAFWSCGYRLAGTGSLLPAHIKKVHIPYFLNETPRVEIEQRLTEQVQRQFNVRAKLDVVRSWGEADAALEAAVKGFVVRPIGFNDQTQANRYEVTIQVAAKFFDTRANKTLWENAHFLFRSEYESTEVVEDYYNQELEAIDRIASDFAETLVATITQGF